MNRNRNPRQAPVRRQAGRNRHPGRNAGRHPAERQKFRQAESGTCTQQAGRNAPGPSNDPGTSQVPLYPAQNENAEQAETAGTQNEQNGSQQNKRQVTVIYKAAGRQNDPDPTQDPETPNAGSRQAGRWQKTVTAEFHTQRCSTVNQTQAGRQKTQNPSNGRRWYPGRKPR